MVIILPIEIYAREVAYKIQLATFLSNNGFQVILAQQHKARKLAVSLGSNCIFLGKHFFRAYDHSYSELIEPLITSNVNFLFLDEEGTEFTNDEDLFTRRMLLRLPFNLLPKGTKFLHWGDKQAKIAKLYGKDFEHHVVGAPSLDVFLIMRRYKEINCSSNPALNFLLVINQEGLTPGGSLSQGSFPELVRKFTINRMSSPAKFSLDEIVEEVRIEAMMIALATVMINKKLNFKLRPHPAQNSEIYEKTFGPQFISNSRVTGILEELSTIDILIHPGCTTAIQAHFAGLKTVQIAVHNEKTIDAVFVDDLKFSNIADVEKKFESNNQIIGKNKNAGLTEFGKSIFANKLDDPGSSFKLICKHAKNLINEKMSGYHLVHSDFIKSNLSLNCSEWLKSMVNNFRSRHFKEFKFEVESIDFNIQLVVKALNLKIPNTELLAPDVLVFNPVVNID
jgi:surface carbohydrate biosynthesis protein